MRLKNFRRYTHNVTLLQWLPAETIAAAIEELFKVEVKKVNTMTVRGRSKRVGRYEGKTADWKKAIVTLTEKSKTIEFFDGLM